jgi:hypothetical protein
MNVNPLSAEYGQIVPWDSLTDAQKQSGQWLKLPTHDENGEPVMAKHVPLDLDPLFATIAPKQSRFPAENTMWAEDIRDAKPLRGPREFDALGKPK